MCDDCRADYDSQLKTLQEVDEHIRKLKGLHAHIEQAQVEATDVRGVVEGALGSLEVYTRVAERFSENYGNSRALDDHSNAQVLANKLLKLVALVFEEPTLRTCFRSGKVNSDQLLKALDSIARPGKLN